jgi:hypothetical protein
MKQREKALAIATAAVLILGLLWTQVLSPRLEEWRTTGENLERLEDQKRNSDDLLRRAPSITEERRSLELALVQGGGANDAIPAFLDRVRALSEAAGFRPTKLDYQRSDRYENAFAELKFEMTARAPLKQIEDFLVRLAGEGQFVHVSSLTITPMNDGSIRADLGLVTLAPLAAADEGKPR